MSDDNNSVSYPILILACVACIITTVLFLDKSGKLRHTEDKEAYAISAYQVIYMDDQAKEAYRLSPKPSHQTATCNAGYLFIANDNDAALQGLLVDYKNRGVKCDATMTPATESK